MIVKIDEPFVIDLAGYPGMSLSSENANESMDLVRKGSKLTVTARDPYAKASVKLQDTQTGGTLTFLLHTRFAEPGCRFSYEVIRQDHFYYADDTSAMQASDLIRTVRRRVIAADGTESDWEVLADLSCIDLNGVTAAQLYEEQTTAYCKLPVSGTITGILPDGSVQTDTVTLGTARIAFKGDVNLDRAVNAMDAADVLLYAAKAGTGSEDGFFGMGDKEVEQLSLRLADVNQDSRINAKDANAILLYASHFGCDCHPDWNKIVPAASG